MKPEDIFSRVVDNAFDFLEKALTEFEKEPKYSVINFHAAVELFLKARLMREHWSLVVSKPESADWKKFLAGDFHSVTIKDAKARLDSIAQDGLTPEQFDSFMKLAGHRNRMVHFFHHGQHDNEKELQKIVAEQCRAWYYLNRLLSYQWAEKFTAHQKQVSKFDGEMLKFRQYLKAKYDDQITHIDAMIQEGIAFRACPSCGFEALKEDRSDEPLLDYNCIVCGLSRAGLAVECPQCDKEILLIGEAYGECLSCNYEISAGEVKDKFVGSHYSMDEGGIAHCSECGSEESVVSVSSTKWLCMECFTPFDQDEINQCEWCSEYSTGNLEDSYLSGCMACDGRLGWDNDKD